MFGRSVIRIVDHDARGRRRAQARDDLSGALVGVAWMLFGFRVEMVALAAFAGIDRLTAAVAGEIVGVVVVLVVVVALLDPRRSRAGSRIASQPARAGSRSSRR